MHGGKIKTRILCPHGRSVSKILRKCVGHCRILLSHYILILNEEVAILVKSYFYSFSKPY
jgi:hypothetical protein